MDGEKGILRYRGIPVEQLAAHATFKETAYLLIYGHLPNKEELKIFSDLLTEYSPVHEKMKIFFQNYPSNAHPMGILSSMVNAMQSFYPELLDQKEEINRKVARLISKIRTLAAMSFKISNGSRVVYPRPDLAYCSNFLNMMFDSVVRPYEISEPVVRALRVCWILHADHEQNCSTSAVRLVGSARVNLYAAVSAGIAALWGPLHGGANQAVVEMLEDIEKSGKGYRHYIERAKDPNDPFRLMGFGHRVYKTYDPRAKIMKQVCYDLLEALHVSDPRLDIARELEEVALSDDYFKEKNLYPNVDFYTGIIFNAMGIPKQMFPVMFAIGRLPGWIAQWMESIYDPQWKLNRPRQIYTGSEKVDFVPIEKR
jgi:citrate synthase